MKYAILGFAIGNLIIGEVKEETEKTITLVNPMEVMTLPAEGKVQISIIPLRFVYNDATRKEVTFSKNKCLFIDDLENIPNLFNGYKGEVEKMNAVAAQGPVNNGGNDSGIITSS